METNELESRFERAFTDEPALRSVPDQLHHGQRAMVRRRVLTAGAGALATVVLIGTAMAASGLMNRDDEPQPAKGDAATIEACREASERKQDADLLFSAGTPTLLTEVEGRERTAVLLSADKKYWGECHVDPTGAREDGNGISAYEMDPPANTQFGGYGSKSGGWTECDVQCHLTVSVLERRPLEVAWAEYTLANGEVLKVRAVHGFIAFEYHEPATRVPGKKVVQRAALYDADGNLLAETVEPGIEPTPGVPSMNDYPNLTGLSFGDQERLRELNEGVPNTNTLVPGDKKS